MNCDDSKPLLHAWLDRELDPGRSLEMEQHLKLCRACLRESQSFESLRSLLAVRATYHAAPRALVRDVRSALRTAVLRETPLSVRLRDRFGELNWWRVGASLTTGGMLVLLALLLVNRPSDEQLWTEAVVAAEVRSLMPNHLTDVASPDQHTVKPWFNGKLDYTPPVVELADKGFPLVGGRLDFLRDHRMACLVYKTGNHFINVFIWPTSSGNTPEKSLTRRGYHIVHWVQSGMDCWAVSDVKIGQVQEFSRLFRAAVEPAEHAPGAAGNPSSDYMWAQAGQGHPERVQGRSVLGLHY